MREELAFNDVVSYTAGKMDCSTVKCYGSDRYSVPLSKDSPTQLSYLPGPPEQELMLNLYRRMHNQPLDSTCEIMVNCLSSDQEQSPPRNGTHNHYLILGPFVSGPSLVGDLIVIEKCISLGWWLVVGILHPGNI